MTIQGEGPSAGRICGFVRLGGCNLSCRWCDTPYTWDWTGVASPTPYDPAEELHRTDVDEVVHRVREMAVELLVISGGEPLNQQRRLVPLLETLKSDGIRVEIETNGTRAPLDAVSDLVDRFVVSPKLSHAGDPEGRRIVPDALAAFASLGKSDFKFVASTPADLDEVDGIVARTGIDPVWIMPEGTDPESVVRTLAALADDVVRRRWNLTGRLHVLAWNDARGV